MNMRNQKNKYISKKKDEILKIKFQLKQIKKKAKLKGH